MYSVLYYRNEAKISDLREFRDLNELNTWLEMEHELKEDIDIISILEEGSE